MFDEHFYNLEFEINSKFKNIAANSANNVF